MEFSILNKRMLEENDDIRKIVDRIPRYEPIFTREQIKSFDLNKLQNTSLILQDYDSIKKIGARYEVDEKKYLTDFDIMLFKWGDILPIIRFEKIKDNSQIISDEEDTLTIQYGRGVTSRVLDSDTLRKINKDSMIGDIVESNRKITILLSEDGKKTQLRVFKN